MKFEDFLSENSDDLDFRIRRAQDRLDKLIANNKDNQHTTAIRSLRERIAELKQEKARS